MGGLRMHGEGRLALAGQTAESAFHDRRTAQGAERYRTGLHSDAGPGSGPRDALSQPGSA